MGLALVLGASACSLGLEQVTPPANFVEQLGFMGQEFTAMPAPAEVMSPDVVLENLRNEGFPPFAPRDARAAAPIYGVLTCRDAAKCAQAGVDADQIQRIWLVVWPEVSGGNGGQAYAVVDADTSAFTFGDGPPGG
jgi:hypothetical protein